MGNFFAPWIGQYLLKIGYILPVSSNQIIEIIESSVSQGKGLSMDCIPDVFLSSQDPNVLELITRFVNQCFTLKTIPTPF